MIEKPDISDEKIITGLNAKYSIQASAIEFLPIGNDATAFSYRVDANNGISYFLKLKTKLSNHAGLFVPRFLKDHGIEQVIAPIPSRSKKLAEEMDEFHFILYPFVSGADAMKVGLSDKQWTEFGSVLKRIHETELPSEISPYVIRETFIPKWSGPARILHEQINTQNFDDPYQKELAAFWKDNNETIQALIEQTERIGKNLQQLDLEVMLCHADIHTANILVTREQAMFIVDWDDTLFAPKERDLMFVFGEETAPTREQQMFFDGYGTVQINQLALAYYRYEWCVQEIGDFGHRVFLASNIGAKTRQESVAGFMQLFSKGDVIEGALNTPLEV